MFEFDTKSTAKDEDAFHFVSYVPVNGRLYELDGLREGPIDLGVCNQDDWISAVRPVIEKRIQNRCQLFSPNLEWPIIYYGRLTATTPALTREGEDEHTLSSEACAIKPTAFFHTADSPCSNPRATASEDNAAFGQLQASPQAPSQTTGVAGARYSEGEIRFNLMAIVSDRKLVYERNIAELQSQLTEEEPMDTDQSSTLFSSIQSEIAKYQLLIEEENQKLKQYKAKEKQNVKKPQEAK
ncbi:UNVERIFIED_CONTAM: hypothetical protein FKN15_050961 [Acipenser sinensis]